eukprot:CAMPEP_0182442596 /NCGR_PEP_ID=MMETSP1172-20130603/1504_1 /TAXON_ID=708627 /ORGANISM="Timspurckia oligopyrenoides, Strain CCMP3278" /LENGTH=282 /DNA_ID=CAMNT_0024637547 /DNA_START=100 /DNA_END=948 /DNA_ORIENTATION=+
MRFLLSSKSARGNSSAPKDETGTPRFNLVFLNDRHATLQVDGVLYPATLMDLPSVVESHKTFDNSTHFKSADIHQVLVVRNPNDTPPDNERLVDGLTPASKGAGVRNSIGKSDEDAEKLAAVEAQIKYVVDHKVSFVQKKETVVSHTPEKMEKKKRKEEKVDEVMEEEKEQVGEENDGDDVMDSFADMLAAELMAGEGEGGGEEMMEVDGGEKEEVEEKGKESVQREVVMKEVSALEREADGIREQIRKMSNPVIKKRLEKKLEDHMNVLTAKRKQMQENQK